MILRSHRRNIQIAFVLVLLILYVVSLFRVAQLSSDKRDKDTLIKGLTNDFSYTQNKLGEASAKITTIELTNSQLLLDIQTSEKELVRLQTLVKKYKREIERGGSIVTLTDTILIRDTIPISYEDSLGNKEFKITEKNNWYGGVFKTFSDYGVIEIGFKNEYSVIMGYERRGLFKREPFTLVTNLNPYSTVQNMRAIRTVVPKKRWGLDLQGGYGTDFNSFTPYIGIGVGYRLISF